jgi:hypothetical protein
VECRYSRFWLYSINVSQLRDRLTAVGSKKTDQEEHPDGCEMVGETFEFSSGVSGAWDCGGQLRLRGLPSGVTASSFTGSYLSEGFFCNGETFFSPCFRRPTSPYTIIFGSPSF